MTFDNTQDHYRGASALIDVSFDAEEMDDRAIQAMNNINSLLEDYDVYVDTTVGEDASADLANEIVAIFAVAAVVIVVVLTLTSKAYVEVPVLVMTFGAAALLNHGHQLPLREDLLHVQLRDRWCCSWLWPLTTPSSCATGFPRSNVTLPTREACIDGIEQGHPGDIGSSSLTTISGLGAHGCSCSSGIGLGHGHCA